MTYISKPQSRESIVIYGDGDEAIFGFVAISSKEGYMLFHIKPTNKMRWRKQIQETPEDGYDLYDGWWKKIYPKELCLQLSFDPDFPMWLILSDWEGNEHTPLFDYFIKLKPLIDRNRDLERKANNLSIALNFKRAEERKRDRKSVV